MPVVDWIIPETCSAEPPPSSVAVTDRFSAVTALLLRGLGLVKVRHFSQPNLLTGRPLVPEFLQEAVNGQALGQALLRQLTDTAGREQLDTEFLKVHQRLRGGAADRAARLRAGTASSASAAGLRWWLSITSNTKS